MTFGTEKFASSQSDSPLQVVVWDLLVRIGHWLLVVLFFVAYLTEDDLLTIHSWAGYGVGLYIVVRVIWGFVGPKHARFADFAYGPVKAVRYLKDLILFKSKRYIGHSPAGGLMVYALLISLAATAVTGTALLAVEENAGPLAPWLGRGAAPEETMKGLSLFAAPARASQDEDERENDNDSSGDKKGGEALEEIHEFFSNLTLLLIIIHIAGVVLVSVLHKENLVRAMVTGRKRSQ